MSSKIHASLQFDMPFYPLKHWLTASSLSSTSSCNAKQTTHTKLDYKFFTSHKHQLSVFSSPLSRFHLSFPHHPLDINLVLHYNNPCRDLSMKPANKKLDNTDEIHLYTSEGVVSLSWTPSERASAFVRCIVRGRAEEEQNRLTYYCTRGFPPLKSL